MPNDTIAPIRRVTRNAPCVVCGRNTWCGVTSGGLAICMRTPSGQPTRNGGWLHRVNSTACTPVLPSHSLTSKTEAAPSRLTGDLRTWSRKVSDRDLQRFAGRLGVSASSLRRLGIGRASVADLTEHFRRWRGGPAWTFPSRRADGSVCGLRVRRDNGTKLSRYPAGLVVPTPQATGGTLLVCEGESDTAAALDFGYPAVGLPGVRSCWAILVDHIVARNYQDVAVVFDMDAAGRLAGLDLALPLSSRVRVKVVALTRSIKDLRDWRRSGGTGEELRRLIDDTPTFQPIPVRTMKHGIIPTYQPSGRAIQCPS